MLNVSEREACASIPRENEERIGEHYLYPGNLFVSPAPSLVTTILGSCVAVCLFDPACRVGGINHYLLPLWNGEGLPTPRYGNVAIDAVVERLVACGALPGRLQAKIFGGAAMWDNRHNLYSVGERNVDLALGVLDQLRIPVVAKSVGGETSRKIIYNTGTGEVLLRCSRGATRGAPKEPVPRPR